MVEAQDKGRYSNIAPSDSGIKSQIHYAKPAENGSKAKVLKALVININEKTTDFGCLVAIARAEARKREHVELNPPILTIQFVPELKVYVAIYEAVENTNVGLKVQR
jgi:hypothetical protein